MADRRKPTVRPDTTWRRAVNGRRHKPIVSPVVDAPVACHHDVASERLRHSRSLVRCPAPVLAEPALLPGALEQSRGHRESRAPARRPGSARTRRAAAPRATRAGARAGQPAEAAPRAPLLGPAYELKWADLRVPERFGATASGCDQPLVRDDNLGRAEPMPARHRSPLRLCLLRGVVGQARCARDGEADRAADQEERRSVLLILAEVARDADRPDAGVRDLARPELYRRRFAGQRGTTGEGLRPLVRVEEALV